ncbi:MAG TPA: ATP-binding protein [Polyangia bacterium]|nr:ATP-binding protein [Polyangia bacterium]
MTEGSAFPYEEKLQHLVTVVQELSLARSLEAVMTIVRRAARELTGADGATFVLRDGTYCHYVDEDAIGPLWKGRRFPMETCVSGWSMLQRQAVVIEDIYADPRVPVDAYRPTFVKSLVTVPIRTLSPVGAIGNYWARRRRARPEEVKLLSALADSTSIAMENVQLYATLERRVEERTAELAASRTELAAKNEQLIRVQRHKEEMASLLIHDLKSPANGIMMSCQARLRRPNLSEPDRQYWKAVQVGAEAIHQMALNLLDISRGEEGAFVPRLAEADLGTILEDVVCLMEPLAESREQRLAIAIETPVSSVRVDAESLRRVLQNLVDNALRYNPSGGTVWLAVKDGPAGTGTIDLLVIDEGPGIPEEMRQRIFDKYTRLEGGPAQDLQDTSVGHGLGLAFCKLAVQGHRGRIWVEPNQPRGSVFVTRLPRDPDTAPPAG